MNINRINVFSHNDFDEKMYRLGIDSFNVIDEKDKAFISIVGTPDCQKNYLHDDELHWFKENTDNVLNLEFDDVSCEEYEYKGVKFYGLNEEQAEQIVRFIEENRGKNFYIHCRAGKSRSQAICRYILDVYGEEYGYDEKLSCRKENPCLTPNIHVHALLLRKYREIFGFIL